MMALDAACELTPVFRTLHDPQHDDVGVGSDDEGNCRKRKRPASRPAAYPIVVGVHFKIDAGAKARLGADADALLSYSVAPLGDVDQVSAAAVLAMRVEGSAGDALNISLAGDAPPKHKELTEEMVARLAGMVHGSFAGREKLAVRRTRHVGQSSYGGVVALLV